MSVDWYAGGGLRNMMMYEEHTGLTDLQLATIKWRWIPKTIGTSAHEIE